MLEVVVVVVVVVVWLKSSTMMMIIVGTRAEAPVAEQNHNCGF